MNFALLRVGLAVAANAVGLIVAALLLDDMSLNGVAFVVALLIFTAVQVIAQPLLRGAARRWAAGAEFLVTLVATFVALLVTDLLSDGLDIEGAVTWVLATVIVWAISMVGDYVLPRVFLDDRRG